MKKRDARRRRYTAYVTAALVGGVAISSVHTVSALDVVTDPAQAAAAQEELPEVTVVQESQEAAGAQQEAPVSGTEQTGTDAGSQVQTPVETPPAETPVTDVPDADAGESDSSAAEQPAEDTPSEDTPDAELPSGDDGTTAPDNGDDADTPSDEEGEDDTSAGDGSDTEVPPAEDGSDTEVPPAEDEEDQDQDISTGNEPDTDPSDDEEQQPDVGPIDPGAASDTDNSESAEGPGNGDSAPVTIVTPGGTEQSGRNSQAVEPDAEETVVPQFYWDNSADAYYEERDYNPSEKFVEDGEKIKYSTDMPLENIPAFITPEMIIGALKVQDVYGYPASVTIAQIIQESGFGEYGPYGDEGQGLSYLAYQYNNLFGVKGTGPAGSVNMATGEQTASGERYTINAGFRVYHTYTEAIEDRAELLTEVYSDLIEGVTDANTFAMRIGSRWATDINYSRSLIRQMETYDLYRLDKMTLGEFSEMLGDFADPCPGAQVTSEFGWREFRNSYHKGIDLGTGTENIPTYAAAAGTVIVAGWSDSAGNWVVIDHGDGMITKYMHHKEIYVEVGDEVEKGQQIGLSGTTGDSTGNHLHFQLEINGAAVDPAPYLFSDDDETEESETAGIEETETAVEEQ